MIFGTFLAKISLRTPKITDFEGLRMGLSSHKGWVGVTIASDMRRPWQCPPDLRSDWRSVKPPILGAGRLQYRDSQIGGYSGIFSGENTFFALRYIV